LTNSSRKPLESVLKFPSVMRGCVWSGLAVWQMWTGR